jgi:DNA polymerase III epsilon subunit-like protein
MERKTSRVLVFDVETTGLIPRNKEEAKPEDFPYITQLSYVVYDTNGWKIKKTGNVYINIPQQVVITKHITDLTGVTRELCDKGTPIQRALREFNKEYMECDIIVAHNISFDREMIKLEMERNKEYLEPTVRQMFDREFEKQNNKFNYCTMYASKNLCKIERTNSKGETYYKSPKLVELYEHLCSMVPGNLHNSLVDTFICLRCFVKMRFKFDLSLKGFPDIPFTKSQATCVVQFSSTGNTFPDYR